jgi:glycosyltransferase involved in cell wall biosynthesis
MSELFTTVTGHPRLSLCMIVRNEAMQLERCLRSIAAWVDEIVVVDTGSEDETPEIAIKFGAKVLNFEWRDDFAVARNFSLANATGDWIIFLDADEELAQGSGTILRQAINAPKKEGFLCQLICLSSLHDQRSANILQALRIFRHRTHYHFSGRVHEQIIDSILKIHPNESIVFTPIVIKHHGYLPEVRKQKKKDERNLKLLLMELEEADASPEIYYYLGSEYNASEETLHALEYYLKAEAINRSSPFSQISILIARNIPLCLYALGRYPEVIERVTNSLSQYLKYTDLLFYRANAWLHLKNPVKAGCDFVTCLKLGDAGYPYPASTGCGSFLVWRPLIWKAFIIIHG